jgi:cytochrome c
MPLKLMAQLLFLLAASSSAAAAGDDAPMVAFNNHCRSCHSIKEDDNRLGPALYGIIGRPAGQAIGYSGYSGGFNGIVWNEKMLDRLMADPASVSSTTNMIFPPVADPDERKKIIVFLKTLGAH